MQIMPPTCNHVQNVRSGDRNTVRAQYAESSCVIHVDNYTIIISYYNTLHNRAAESSAYVQQRASTGRKGTGHAPAIASLV